MTKCIKDIKNQVWRYCSSVHFLELDRLLSKLDTDNLELLYDMIEDAYEAGQDGS